MGLIESIGAIAQLATVGIRAARDPAWSQRTQQIRDEHITRISEYARASREMGEAIAEGDEVAAMRGSAGVRDLLLRELAARGNTVSHPSGIRGPTLEIPLYELDAIFAELSGRRRDAELGEQGATLKQS
ncbi:MAG: hypothetical protein HY360_07615 [Verrucomicrobia bacterium]|nr:hypothetical protein [Verrucomicrobiota bacterium]